MILLNEKFDLESFWSDIRQSSESIILLDYDGTLAPFTPDRDNAGPYEGVIPRLERLIVSPKTRLIMISGRDIKTLQSLIGLKRSPEIWGNHGAEWYHPDSGYALMVGPMVLRGLELVKKWAKSNLDSERVEIKPAGCAFHWRSLSAKLAESIEKRVVDQWQSELVQYELELHRFSGGIEIRPAKLNKGTAIKQITQTLNRSCPIAYLGDDMTDEDAFRELGDQALKVLVNERTRPTRADIQISPPDELLDFLDRWLDCA